LKHECGCETTLISDVEFQEHLNTSYIRNQKGLVIKVKKCPIHNREGWIWIALAHKEEESRF